MHQAQFSPKTPYITDSLSLIEGLRNRPEHTATLKALGYDSVIYASRVNITKGASGWGNDAAQYVVLDHSVLSDWSVLSNKPTKTHYLPDVENKHIIQGLTTVT